MRYAPYCNTFIQLNTMIIYSFALNTCTVQ